MHTSKKGNQWYFGMKAQIGVDADSGLVHTVRGTTGHVSDISEGNALMHKGLKKNTDQLIKLFALSNLRMVRTKLIGVGA